MSDLFGPQPVRWKVSGKWARRQHDCTLRGIMERCGGKCCNSRTFWPPKSGATGCPALGPQGCTFSAADKPVTCHLYPMRLNSNGTLVGHNRATTTKGLCKGNHGRGPMIIDTLAGNLTALFGLAQYARVRADVVAGRDSYFDVSPALLAALDAEAVQEAANAPPLPRNGELTD